MSISASWGFCLKESGCCHDDLFAGARERWRSGSRWSARSDARTNDLEAGASPRRMIQVVSGVVATPDEATRISRLREKG